jgi:hypothetical protein
MIELFFFVGIFFGFLAGLIAFLITLNEWKSHGFKGWELWGEPLKRGIATWAFFLLLSVALGYIMPFVIQ